MRIGLAFRAFFAALFGQTLPKELIPSGLLPEPTPAPPSPTPAPAPEPKAKAPPAPKGPEAEAVAVQTLGLLQREGRLIDFLFEDLDGFSDAEIGAAVREVHRGCRKALTEHFDLEAIRSEDEEALVDVETGYDPNQIRLTGNISGSPPFSGVLRHRGWRATAVRLPKVQDGARVLVPAEVEVT